MRMKKPADWRGFA
ncbi:hypothetical protein YPPY95_4888, partial [Yersinia pestis PY-95]